MYHDAACYVDMETAETMLQCCLCTQSVQAFLPETQNSHTLEGKTMTLM